MSSKQVSSKLFIYKSLAFFLTSFWGGEVIMEQESQKRKLEGTSFDSSSENTPLLCQNSCGFFGNPKTNNFCSKCYKEFLLTHPLPQEPEIPQAVENPPPLDQANDSAGGAAAVGGEDGAASEEKRPGPNRCSFCKKRVGLTGFKCRCEHLFCSIHRYSEKHNCVFNYRSAGQDAIAKANPVIKADKIEKI